MYTSLDSDQIVSYRWCSPDRSSTHISKMHRRFGSPTLPAPGFFSLTPHAVIKIALSLSWRLSWLARNKSYTSNSRGGYQVLGGALVDSCLRVSPEDVSLTVQVNSAGWCGLAGNVGCQRLGSASKSRNFLVEGDG